MKLSPAKAQYFFSLYLPLLSYTYENFYGDNKIEFFSTDMKTKIKVRDILCNDSGIINEIIRNMPDKFNQEDVSILQKWKNFRRGSFIVLKHLKNYSLFLETSRDPKTYGVSGISDSLSDLIPDVPRMVDAVLLEFDSRIICDGLFIMRNVQFGKGYRQDFMNSLKESESRSGIISKSFI